MITAQPRTACPRAASLRRHTAELASVLAEETHAGPEDLTPWVVAHALLGVHRAMLDSVRRRALAANPTHASLVKCALKPTRPDAARTRTCRLRNKQSRIAGTGAETEHSLKQSNKPVARTIQPPRGRAPKCGRGGPNGEREQTARGDAGGERGHHSAGPVKWVHGITRARHPLLPLLAVLLPKEGLFTPERLCRYGLPCA